MPRLTFRPEPFEGFAEFDEFEGEASEFEEEISRSNAAYIKWVQQSLNKILGLNLAVDGISGPLTRSAVRTFQQRGKLVVDGIVGPKTEAALMRAGAAAPPTTGTGGGIVGPPISSTCKGLRTPCEIIDRFDFDRDQVKPQHQPQIINIARCIHASRKSSKPISILRVIGHADAEGGPDYNIDLGRRRAEQVKRHIRDTLERMLPGSSAGLTVTVETRGETQPASSDPAANRRVEVCQPSPVVVPPTPQATPVTRSFKIVVKSFIMPIGSRAGATSCMIGSDDDALALFATAIDAVTSENPPTDLKDKVYRLYSTRTITVTCLEGRLTSFSATPLDTDVGLECFIKPACLTPPPIIVMSNAAGPSGVSSIDFSWRVKGKPHPWAEPAFQAVCDRDSVFIWHEVAGRIECTASGPSMALVTVAGSRFPSHRVWVNGVVPPGLFIPQGVFSNLWVGTTPDPTLVR